MSDLFLGFFGAESGIRTRTPHSGHRLLRPPRLPFRHPGPTILEGATIQRWKRDLPVEPTPSKGPFPNFFRKRYNSAIRVFRQMTLPSSIEGDKSWKPRR